MDLNSILNQVLDVAKNSASKLETGNQTIDSLTKVGGGAALGGILSMILGRSGGASLAKLGSLAVLGNLAYQAYQNYQKSQQNSQPNISENAFDVLNSSSHVDAGELILRTMTAAAAADGEITNAQSVPRRSDRRIYGSCECNGNSNDLGNRKRCKHVGNGDISAIIRGFTHIFRYLYL